MTNVKYIGESENTMVTVQSPMDGPKNTKPNRGPVTCWYGHADMDTLLMTVPYLKFKSYRQIMLAPLQ